MVALVALVCSLCCWFAHCSDFVPGRVWVFGALLLPLLPVGLNYPDARCLGLHVVCIPVGLNGTLPALPSRGFLSGLLEPWVLPTLSAPLARWLAEHAVFPFRAWLAM